MDRGSELFRRVDEHPYPIFFEINDIDHSKTKVKDPQSNAIFYSILCPSA